MKETRMPPAQSANLVANSGNTIYGVSGPGGRFKSTYELLNLRALKYSRVNKIYIFQSMDKIFCVEFQRYPLKFHTIYLTHILKDMLFIQHWIFKSSLDAFLKRPPPPPPPKKKKKKVIK